MDWKYIAGYFDADGNFHVRYLATRPSFQLLIRIYSTNHDVLKDIQEFVGYGSIYIKKRRGKEKNWNTLYEYTIAKKSETKHFLAKILPYLIVKKNQGDFLFNNFNFDVGFSNVDFDIDKFRKPITRVGVKRKHYPR